jgi:hypothetical protein
MAQLHKSESADPAQSAGGCKNRLKSSAKAGFA